MSELKRVSMAGADVSVTAAELADLLLEYAKQLGRIGTTDTVTFPVALDGRVGEASILLGPASQIALTENLDRKLERVDIPGIDEATADVRNRLSALLGRTSSALVDDDERFDVEFLDFDGH